jgi:hypothetical protein
MNPRVIVFVLVALALIGFPAYVFIDEKVSGGVKDRGSFFEVNLKAMSNFEFDQNAGTLEDVPERWRNMSGKKVMLTGEMWQPQAAAGTITEFELVYSIAKCCFSGPPKIQHFVLGRVKDGAQVGFHEGLVEVVGTLHVNVEKSEGKVTRVFTLDVESVKPI